MTETMTFKDMIKSHTIETYNYMKHDAARNSSKQITGKALKLNECDNVVVIDVDINHDMSNEEKQKIRETFMQVLINFNGLIVSKTGNGGLHIWTKREGYECNNRATKWFKSENYDIDLFNSDMKKDKRSLIVLPPSRVRNSIKKIVKYEYILGNEDTPLTTTTKEIIEALTNAELISNNERDKQLLKLLHEIEQNKDKFAPINNLNDDVAVFVEKDNEQQQTTTEINESHEYEREIKVINGFNGVEIHNDAGNRSIQQEITLLTLFQALNALPEKVIDYAYEFIKHNAKLTSSALEKWDSEKTRHMGKKSSSFVLVKMLKIHNKEYYEKILKPIYEKPIDVKTISRNDPFMWDDLVKNCNHDVYKSTTEAAEDMTRLMRIYDNTNIFWLVKDSDGLFKIVSDETQHKKLFRVKCCGTNLWNIFIENSDLFRIRGISFNSKESGLFNIFQGFKHEPIENEEKLKIWHDFVKEIICSNNEKLFNYVQHWIAFIVQHPGKKTETALLMGGLQGIGKGTFVKCLARLFDGYVNPNITNMEELTGSFNTAIEGVMLVVCNELKNVGEERTANFDCLKSLITEYDIRYNEKGVPRRNGENNANFIFMSNNAYVVKVEVDDRRYVAFNVNPSKRGDNEYWTMLNTMIENDNDFISAVMFDYLNNYTDDFNLRDIPKTQLREDLIDASKSDIVVMIEEHYRDFVNGTIIYDNWKPVGMKNKTFGIQMAKYCDKKKSTARDETRNKMIYTLKKEWIELLTDNQPKEEEPDEDAF